MHGHMNVKYNQKTDYSIDRFSLPNFQQFQTIYVFF
jgi:hypothetical protein